MAPLASPVSSSTTPPSDESGLYELSFDYEQNSAGEWKRVSKGRSSPPTPVDKQSPPSTDLIPPPSGNPSPPPPRLSLTRSESLPGIPSTLSTERPDPIPSAQSALRSFQRALSGPISLPQSTSQQSHTPGQPSSTHVRTILAGGLRSAGRTTGGPRRVTLEEFNQINEKLKIQQQQEQEELDLQTAGLPQDEKENRDGSSLPPIEGAAGSSSIHRRYSPPRSSDAHYSYFPSRYSAIGATSSSNLRSTLAEVVPVPQRPSLPMPSATSSTRQVVAGPSRISRVNSHGQKKFTPGLAIDKISEIDGADDGVYADPAAGSETDGGVDEKQPARSQPPTRQRVNALTRSATRPRRSASLSDASSKCLLTFEMKRSLTVMTSAGASRRATFDDRGLALWCAPRDEYGSDQLPCRGGARNVRRKEAA